LKAGVESGELICEHRHRRKDTQRITRISDSFAGANARDGKAKGERLAVKHFFVDFARVLETKSCNLD
jgi:hypothetical protein